MQAVMMVRAALLPVVGAAVVVVSAPLAQADPADPAPPPAPVVVSAQEQPATTGVPHLSSPENLPPGTTEAPAGTSQRSRLSYLRELWHAYRTQEVNGSGALLLLTQRPMNADAVPPNGMPAGPQPPIPVAPAPADGPAPVPAIPLPPAA